MKKLENIYLSVIAASRNDNHGENLDQRTNIFIKSLAENCKKYQIKSELILVEWNQIPNTKTLSDRLDLVSNEYLNSKIITVKKDHHLKLPNSDRLNFFQMIAKNVGIRRASGEFILATNIDVILNQKIYEFIAQKKLEKNTIYRCNRHCINYNYSGNIDDNYLDQFTNFIDKKYYSFDTKTNSKHHVQSSIFRYLNIFNKDFSKKISIKNLKSIIKKIIFYFKYYNVIPVFFFQKKLFTNACGDFTLLDKNSWIKLKGYCELPIYSWHLDSLFLWEARFKKYKFYDFKDKYYIYHMNHLTSGVISVKEDLFDNLNNKKIPYLTNEDFLDLASKFSKNPDHLKTNEFWGLHNEKLN